VTIGAEAQGPPQQLSPRVYGATAFVATLLAFACFARFGLSAEAFIAAFVAAVLTVLSAVDIDRHLLPNRIVLPSAALVLAANLVFFSDRWLEWILSAAGAALLFGIALVVYPAGLGMGDVKLALLLGAALGLDVVPAMAIGSLAAALWGVVLLIRHGAAARKQAMPLGPFLALGAVLVLLAG
jgi:leader peptidase (prepilin peptidase) / N-methyltransferase